MEKKLENTKEHGWAWVTQLEITAEQVSNSNNALLKNLDQISAYEVIYKGYTYAEAKSMGVSMASKKRYTQWLIEPLDQSYVKSILKKMTNLNKETAAKIPIKKSFKEIIFEEIGD